jgi:hypothetical protein
VTIFAYRPSWNGGFLWDDDAYITNNELLTARNGLQRIWFSPDSPSRYFPLTYTTFRIEHALWGLNPTGYHWVNLLLHVANALLVWAVLAALKRAGRVARGRDLCPTSGAGRIGGLDHGTKEPANGLFLFAYSACLDCVP